MTSIPIPDELINEIASRVAEIIDHPEDNWIDATRAAEYLGIPKSTLHKLSSARKIPFEQDTPGGKLYFKRSALDAWREA